MLKLSPALLLTVQIQTYIVSKTNTFVKVCVPYNLIIKAYWGGVIFESNDLILLNKINHTLGR